MYANEGFFFLLSIVSYRSAMRYFYFSISILFYFSLIIIHLKMYFLLHYVDLTSIVTLQINLRQCFIL